MIKETGLPEENHLLTTKQCQLFHIPRSVLEHRAYVRDCAQLVGNTSVKTGAVDVCRSIITYDC